MCAQSSQARDVAAERRGAAAHDGRHRRKLAEVTCPASALRQAAPWRPKMSATSSLARLTAAGSGLRSRLPLGERPEPVERADHRADRGGGDPGVERGGVELGVPKSTWITRMSMSCSSRWVAKLCRSVCGVTRFLISAMWAAAWQARLS